MQTPSISLPSLPNAQHKTALSSSNHAATACRQRILFVDDELVIGKLGGRILAKNGFVPIIFQNATQALAAFQAAPDSFDLVLTDLMMPEMTGVQLAMQIRAVRPNMPVVLTTGYGGQVVSQHMEHSEISWLLPKPFSTQELIATVERALTGATGSSPATE
jgi:DNA-binding NtrC family response regulator